MNSTIAQALVILGDARKRIRGELCGRTEAVVRCFVRRTLKIINAIIQLLTGPGYRGAYLRKTKEMVFRRVQMLR